MGVKPFNWNCPHCGKSTTIVDANFHEGSARIGDELANNKYGDFFGYWYQAIACPNEECREVTFWFFLGQQTTRKPVQAWRLWPEQVGRPQPSAVPVAIAQSYYEACRILRLSASASATMSRRCLQAMIRDFHKVKKRSLFLEVEAIKKKVDPSVWKAIHTVREMGNLGAHMHKNVDMILDVEPKEAQALITLVEMLFSEWYVARHAREALLEGVIKVGQDKKKALEAAAKDSGKHIVVQPTPSTTAPTAPAAGAVSSAPPPIKTI